MWVSDPTETWTEGLNVYNQEDLRSTDGSSRTFAEREHYPVLTAFHDGLMGCRLRQT